MHPFLEGIKLNQKAHHLMDENKKPIFEDFYAEYWKQLDFEKGKPIAIAFHNWCKENPEYTLSVEGKFDIFIKQYQP